MMVDFLTIHIHNIKGIKNGIIEMPIENGIYGIVGNNGCGKSTIMSCLAQIISRHNLGQLRQEDFDDESFVSFSYKNVHDKWYCEENFWKSSIYPNSLRFNGTYEGSLFYGMRFKDSRIVDELMDEGRISDADIVDADPYIIEQLGYILHGDNTRYEKIKKIRNKEIAERLKLKNTPYFLSVNDKVISQYRMSSGECLLISLLHFIYNSIIRRSLPTDQPILLLIDEIELALHPVAVTRLMNLLSDLVDEYEHLAVVITSHSPEVIKQIKPKNMYKIERVDDINNAFSITNPCYPSYAIREIYTHDGFDYLLLVEDQLAKLVVQNSISELELENSRLINIVPVGGWKNVLKLQYELASNNVLGVGKNVFSILDGDVEDRVNKNNEFKELKKFFLPIESVEKFLRYSLVISPNQSLKKKVNDKFFKIESLDTVIKEYLKHENDLRKQQGELYKEDYDGKHFYDNLIKTLKKYKISEDIFIEKLYDIIIKEVDFSKFKRNLYNAFEL